jgi:hypothetical protein
VVSLAVPVINRSDCTMRRRFSRWADDSAINRECAAAPHMWSCEKKCQTRGLALYKAEPKGDFGSLRRGANGDA